MVSREGRGEYGTGVKPADEMTEEDIRNMNPHGHKLTKIPEEKTCIVCDSVKEYIFPINNAIFCVKHGNELREHKGEYIVSKPYYTISKPMFCFKCGELVSIGWNITTRACLSCVQKAGKYEMGWRARKYARRVA